VIEMADAHAKRIIQQAIDRLIAGLDKGHSHQLTAYLSAMARFHAYSLGNILLIKTQLPKASRVAGYCAWQTLGRFVRKGEHGIRIQVPIVCRDRRLDGDDERVVAFKTGYVFDISQTGGRPLPDFSRVGGDPDRYLEVLKAALAKRGIDLEYVEAPASVQGWSEGGRVVIRRELAPAEEFSVLVHEVAHELLHRGDRVPGNKAMRETEAEAVAFVVCDAIGLDTGTAASDYIQLWNGNRDMLLASLDRIHRTAGAILGDLGLVEEAGEPLSVAVQRPAA
jgi:hypothetical protein